MKMYQMPYFNKLLNAIRNGHIKDGKPLGMVVKDMKKFNKNTLDSTKFAYSFLLILAALVFYILLKISFHIIDILILMYDSLFHVIFG